MPRIARREAPGSVIHVISRFVNREFRLDEPGGRAEYLRRAGLIFGGGTRRGPRTDWIPIAFALMSTHVHWALVAGRDPSSSWVRPLHVGFAGWLNRKQGRLGPVFAERHRTIVCEGETAAGLVPYLHNNPGRARVVRDPVDCTWTSHRAYVGLSRPPEWLDIRRGLSLCGYADTPTARRSFHDLVLSRSGQARSTEYSGDDLAGRRASARRKLGGPVELATPSLCGSVQSPQLRTQIVVPDACLLLPPWEGKPTEVIELVVLRGSVAMDELLSRSRRRLVSNARRLCLHLWSHELGRPVIEMARALGLGSAGAAYLLSRVGSEMKAEARTIGALLRGQVPAGTERQS